MAAPGAITSSDRIKLTAFIKDQIAQGNIEWASQKDLARAALGPNTQNSGTIKIVINEFKNQLTFGTGNDTQLFKTFLKEKIAQLPPGEKLSFKGNKPQKVAKKEFTEWMEKNYGRKPKIYEKTIYSIIKYGGTGGGKYADPEIKGRVEWGAEWDPKEAYRAAVAKNQMFGGKQRDKYSLPEGAEDEFAEFFEKNKGKKTYSLGSRAVSKLSQEGKNISTLLERFAIAKAAEERAKKWRAGNKITEAELTEEMGFKSRSQLSGTRKIAEKVDSGAPLSKWEQRGVNDSRRHWNWLKATLRPKKIIDEAYNVGDKRRLKWVYDNPTKDQLNDFNTNIRNAPYRPATLKTMKKIWLDKNIVEGTGKTLKELINNGELPTLKQLNDTLKTSYTPAEGIGGVGKIVRALQGFGKKGSEFIPVNEKAGTQLMNIMAKARWGNPYAREYRDIAVQTIDQELGRAAGTHNKWVNQLRQVLKENKIPIYSVKKPYGFQVNEVASLTATFTNKAYPYSQFIDLAEGSLNSKLGGFQGVGFSQYLTELREELADYKKTKNPASLEKAKGILDRFNTERDTWQKGTLKEYRLPKIFLDIPEAGEGYYKPVGDIYAPEKVQEWSEKYGLDLEGHGKRELINIDVGQDKIPLQQAISEEYRPTLLNKIKTLYRKEFENNTNNICPVIFGARPLAKGGSVNGCADQFDEALEKNPEGLLNKVANVETKSSVIGKMKNVAQRALMILPRMGTPGKIAAGAVAGAAAIGALTYNKELGEFVNPLNDDKASQATVTEWIKDNPVKTVAGTSIGFSAQEIPGAYKKARELGRGRTRSALGITGALKPVLTTFGTPAMTALFEVPFSAKRLEEGETMTEVLTDPFGPALGLTFMEPLSKGAGVIRDAPKRTWGQAAKGYFDLSNVGKARPGMTSKFLRMGLSPRMIAGASRFLGLPGLALSLGLTGYDAYKNYQNQEGMLYNLFNRDE